MYSEKSSVSRHRPGVLCALLLLWSMLCAATAPRVLAQAADDYEAMRQRAIQLVNQEKFAEALPLFEKLAALNPADEQVMYGLGIAIFTTSRDIKDDEARRRARVRARTALVRAKELGVRDENLDLLLKSITPDGGEPGVSKNKEANAAMLEATRAFANRDFKEAAKVYERAARLDPTLYEAALYTGNSYYGAEIWDKAGEWFARAIAIDADRETAYRYWGDALMLSGKQVEARDKFFDAIVAEPYNQLAWRGLAQWAQRNQVKLHRLNIQPPNKTRTEGNQTTLTIDPKTLESNDGSSHWLMYDITRVAWAKGNFFKYYPNEKTYRHSLREEATALRMVAEFAAKDLKEGKIKALEPSLATLVKLHEEGLIEAYVLLARPDQGIVQDYPEYRKANRDKLRKFLAQYVVSEQTGARMNARK